MICVKMLNAVPGLAFMLNKFIYTETHGTEAHGDYFNVKATAN